MGLWWGGVGFDYVINCGGLWWAFKFLSEKFSGEVENSKKNFRRQSE